MFMKWQLMIELNQVTGTATIYLQDATRPHTLSFMSHEKMYKTESLTVTIRVN